MWFWQVLQHPPGISRHSALSPGHCRQCPHINRRFIYSAYFAIPSFKRRVLCHAIIAIWTAFLTKFLFCDRACRNQILHYLCTWSRKSLAPCFLSIAFLLYPIIENRQFFTHRRIQQSKTLMLVAYPPPARGVDISAWRGVDCLSL